MPHTLIDADKPSQVFESYLMLYTFDQDSMSSSFLKLHFWNKIFLMYVILNYIYFNITEIIKN